MTAVHSLVHINKYDDMMSRNIIPDIEFLYSSDFRNIGSLSDQSRDGHNNHLQSIIKIILPQRQVVPE